MMRVFYFSIALVIFLGLLTCYGQQPRQTNTAIFTPIQPTLFKGASGQAVAWADYDNDNDLDLIVGFKNEALRLYNNTNGIFKDVAAEVGLNTESIDTRALSWGDYNQDGLLDLYVGYGRDTGQKNRLYKNKGQRFVDVAKEVGVDMLGTTRQVCWVDYDNDGDSDLYISMRDRNNILLRNEGKRFINVSKETGMSDPRRTVACVWFDFDKDGDLDMFIANQSGDRDGFYRNEGGYFTDIAADLNLDRFRRPLREGSVGAAVADYDNDGDFDLFVGLYGADLLYENDGKGHFTDVAGLLNIASPDKVVGVDWGDYDNDGWQDLYVVGYQTGIAHGYDKLYRYHNKTFSNVIPEAISLRDGDHGVRWADYDNDGDLDLAITNRHRAGQHSVFRNDLIHSAQTQSIKILLLDKDGNYTKQGCEIRLYTTTDNQLIGSRLVDTGGGYVSQNAMPVHFGLGKITVVDVEVTLMSKEGRVKHTISNLNVRDYKQKPLVIKLH